MRVDLPREALAGNRRALARLLTIVENGGADARAALTELFPQTGRAWIVGVTGSPGTGKSTLIATMARIFRSQGYSVGIVAVDPTSPFSGGAILGDRVRMMGLIGDPGIFIRSMATRGHLGGLARTTMDVARVLDACGYQVLLIETVGVGQDEVEIAGHADTTVVIQVPGLGDDVQAIKAGVMEIADIYVVNKADRDGADQVIGQIQMILSLGEHGAWVPPIVRAVAIRDEGIGDLVAAVGRHRAYLESSGHIQRARLERARNEILTIAREEFTLRLLGYGGNRIDDLARCVAERRIDPYAAAERLTEATLRGYA